MTTLQKTVVTAALAVAAGAGIFEAHQAAQLRGQNQTLQQQQAPLAEQIRQLQRERDDATNRLAGMAEEIAKNQKNNLELLRLRAEVSQLKSSASEAQAKQKQGEPDGYLAMAQIQFSGYDTPQAAYKSFRWALVNSNYDDWNASMSLQDRNEPDNTGAFRGYVASSKALTGLQILGEKKLGDDRVGLKVREDDDGGNIRIVVWPILRVGDQWKIHLDPQGYYRGWEQDTNEESRQSVPKAWILPEQPKSQ